MNNVVNQWNLNATKISNLPIFSNDVNITASLDDFKSLDKTSEKYAVESTKLTNTLKNRLRTEIQSRLWTTNTQVENTWVVNQAQNLLKEVSDYVVGNDDNTTEDSEITPTSKANKDSLKNKWGWWKPAKNTERPSNFEVKKSGIDAELLDMMIVYLEIEGNSEWLIKTLSLFKKTEPSLILHFKSFYNELSKLFIDWAVKKSSKEINSLLWWDYAKIEDKINKLHTEIIESSKSGLKIIVESEHVDPWSENWDSMEEIDKKLSSIRSMNWDKLSVLIKNIKEGKEKIEIDNDDFNKDTAASFVKVLDDYDKEELSNHFWVETDEELYDIIEKVFFSSLEKAKINLINELDNNSLELQLWNEKPLVFLKIEDKQKFILEYLYLIESISKLEDWYDLLLQIMQPADILLILFWRGWTVWLPSILLNWLVQVLVVSWIIKYHYWANIKPHLEKNKPFNKKSKEITEKIEDFNSKI